MPKYYIYSSKYVAENIKFSHKEWLNKPGKNRQLNNDNSMREFKYEINYKDKWDYFE